MKGTDPTPPEHDDPDMPDAGTEALADLTRRELAGRLVDAEKMLDEAEARERALEADLAAARAAAVAQIAERSAECERLGAALAEERAHVAELEPLVGVCMVCGDSIREGERQIAEGRTVTLEDMTAEIKGGPKARTYREQAEERIAALERQRDDLREFFDTERELTRRFVEIVDEQCVRLALLRAVALAAVAYAEEANEDAVDDWNTLEDAIKAARSGGALPA